MNTVRLHIQGMTCASCSGRIERVLRKRDEVATASVNLATETATIATRSDELRPLIEAIQKAGFDAHPKEDGVPPASRQSDRIPIALSGILAAFLMLPMVGIPLSPWVQLAAAFPVQVLAWVRFGPKAIGAARHGTATMDTLVVIGTTAAFALSLAQFPDGALYFESAATITAFVLVGKALERRARNQATEAVRELMALRPPVAHLHTETGLVDVPAEAVGTGQTVSVRAGERIPVDGVILTGTSAVDESLLTGESHPVERGPGSPVIGGSVNGHGPLEIRSTATGSDATLARIVRLVEQAVATKPPIQKRVDQIAAVFVPLVLGLALLTTVGWAWILPLPQALLIGVAVLVVACPCALGLATPAALVAGTGAAARAGIFIRDADALEGLATITAIAFDKTGTLTEGNPTLQTPLDPECLLRVSSLQGAVVHPLAKAFQTDTPLPVTDAKNHPGLGISGRVHDRMLWVGSAAFMRQQGLSTAPYEAKAAQWAHEGLTAVWVAEDGHLVDVVGVGDRLRDSATAAVQRVRDLGLTPVLISGDKEEVVRATAATLGIQHVVAEAKPAQKMEVLASFQPAGMVGDGVNDAPALSAARVGIAMGSGAAAAIASAPVTLLRAEPSLVPAAVEIGRATQRIVRQNLFWAFAYNVVAIPLAAAGILTPMVAAGAMALSSVSVVANALRLRSWTP